MNLAEITFKLANTLTGIAWIVLIFSPPRSTAVSWISKGWVSTALSTAYFTSLAVGFDGFQNGGGFSTIAHVRILFQNDWLLLAGWIHYLAFDLLIGARIAKDIHHTHWLIKTTCLILTFLFGPIGWICSRLFHPKQETL
jgi:Domain of unknown function (DUF4281)